MHIVSFIQRISPQLPAAQLANIHTLFNIVTTIVLFPFAEKIANISTFIIRGEDEKRIDLSLRNINDRNKDATLAFSDLVSEVRRMFEIAKENYKLSIRIFFKYDEEKYDEIMGNELVINYLNKEITKYIIENMDRTMDNTLASRYSSYLTIVRSIKRIEDHVKNIAENSKYSTEENLVYTDESKRELSAIDTAIMTMFQTVLTTMDDKEKRTRIKNLEEKVEKYIAKYRIYHIERMKNRICDPESGLIFEKHLTAMERVSSYINTVANLRYS